MMEDRVFFLAAAFSCLLTLVLCNYVPPCTEEKPELPSNDASFTVDCQTAAVAWGPGGAGNIHNVAVKYKCDNDTQVEVFFADINMGTRVVSNYPPTNKTQVCIFRMCYSTGGIHRYQATPQICNYISEHHALSSTMLTVLPTSHSVSSTLTETTHHSLIESQTQASLFDQIHTTIHAPSSSPLTSSSSPSSSADPSQSIFVTSIAAAVVLVVVIIIVGSFLLVVAWKKRAHGFSKGIHEVNLFSEESFAKGFEIVCKGELRSFTSLITVIQPLEKTESLLKFDIKSSSEEDTMAEKMFHDKTSEPKNYIQSAPCQKDRFVNPAEHISSSSSSSSLESINHTNSETEESEMKIAFPDSVESNLFTYNKPDNSGYLEYSSSDQYITAESYLPNLSWESAEKNKVQGFSEVALHTSHDQYEDYDEYALCSQ